MMKYAKEVLESFKRPAVESFVSNEGIFDAFVKFIKGYNKDSPGDERNGKPISSYRWISDQAKEIADTFGNEGWVESNYHPLKGQLPKEMTTALSYKGTIPKPAEGIALGSKLVQKFLAEFKPALTEYSNSLDSLEDSALKRIRDGEDSVAVAKDTLQKVSKIKLPIQPNFKYDDLMGGLVLAGRSSKPSPVKETLPELTIEDVVAAGKALVNAIKDYDQFFKETVSAGSGCDTSLWKYPGFDYNIEDPKIFAITEDLYDYFYFQAVPDEQTNMQYDAIFGYAEYIREVGRWLQAYTR